ETFARAGPIAPQPGFNTAADRPAKTGLGEIDHAGAEAEGLSDVGLDVAVGQTAGEVEQQAAGGRTNAAAHRAKPRQVSCLGQALKKQATEHTIVGTALRAALQIRLGA